jgi:hypothetical protein
MKNLFIIKAITSHKVVYGIRPEKIHRNWLRDLFRILTYGPNLITGRVHASFVPDCETLFVRMQLYYGPHEMANDAVNGTAGFRVCKNGEFDVTYTFTIEASDWHKWKEGDEA